VLLACPTAIVVLTGAGLAAGWQCCCSKPARWPLPHWGTAGLLACGASSCARALHALQDFDTWHCNGRDHRTSRLRHKHTILVACGHTVAGQCRCKAQRHSVPCICRLCNIKCCTQSAGTAAGDDWITESTTMLVAIGDLAVCPTLSSLVASLARILLYGCCWC
jgi:hypothetical protein